MNDREKTKEQLIAELRESNEQLKMFKTFVETSGQGFGMSDMGRYGQSHRVRFEVLRPRTSPDSATVLAAGMPSDQEFAFGRTVRKELSDLGGESGNVLPVELLTIELRALAAGLANVGIGGALELPRALSILCLCTALAFGAWWTQRATQPLRSDQAYRQARQARDMSEQARHESEEARQEAEVARHASEEARQEAERISAFLLEMFESARPGERGGGREVKVVEILQEAARKLDADLVGQPARRARLQAKLGQTYYSLGLYPEAIALQEKSLQLRLKTLGHLPQFLKYIGQGGR